ncbi:ATP-binding protein [Yinghuangia sp. ASG 101]|uniref:ATP-binding protein n=1 Tax=Yinghuangia sp. ASG 101 TaxID=2896848 RepID=UPI001E5CE97F|nr:ATP-binding protein [Yinghuangia sp. ASG 101]UGQ12913.1 ATP-binding protein [Yinghuangia sp. ASG 101]
MNSGNASGTREPATVVADDGDCLLMVDMGGTPGSVRVARRSCADFLARATSDGGQPMGSEATTDILLVVGELVANACRHAPGPCRLTVALSDHGADVAVRDTGRGMLRLVGGTGAGYGLLIVARLTEGIHVLPLDDGKVVRATVPLPGPRPTNGVYIAPPVAPRE